MKSGGSGWTPKESTYFEKLIISLGGRYEVRSIATQGRALTNEYVTEYIVEYSDNGNDGWRAFHDANGQIEVDIMGFSLHVALYSTEAAGLS